ncbi:MAG: hypothetical protein HWD62_14490 [Cyclobacteriaceae bacterium]|nr:MAG: hypothetical protein HWD62_14490 [Cyclobacteriaceae bacterium]
MAEGKQVEIREGTSQGVDNLPYFSKVFNVINQMLFSIKAEAVAERAIARLKEGKKPVIAFASTMGSFIEQMESDAGLSVTDGDTINADFSVVLQKDSMEFFAILKLMPMVKRFSRRLTSRNFRLKRKRNIIGLVIGLAKQQQGSQFLPLT